MDEALNFQFSATRFAKGHFQLIAGLGGRFTQDAVEGIPELWKQLLPYIGKTPGQIGRETYGVCCNPDGKGSFEYIAGVAISKLDDLPERYRCVELAEQEYAVLEHQGPLGSVRNVSALGYAALKTGSECSFTTRKVVRDPGRSSPVFALPKRRSKTFRTAPNTPWPDMPVDLERLAAPFRS